MVEKKVYRCVKYFIHSINLYGKRSELAFEASSPVIISTFAMKCGSNVYSMSSHRTEGVFAS